MSKELREMGLVILVIEKVLTPLQSSKKLLSIGTPKTIIFPFAPHGKSVEFSGPNI